MNTITKVITTTWVSGEALNRAMRSAETRRTSLPTSMPLRWIYSANGNELANTDLFGPIVIQVQTE